MNDSLLLYFGDIFAENEVAFLQAMKGRLGYFHVSEGLEGQIVLTLYPRLPTKLTDHGRHRTKNWGDWIMDEAKNLRGDA